MKLTGYLFFLLTIVYACRPHYDFSKERTTIRNEQKNDSLLYQVAFSAPDQGWTLSGKSYQVNTDGYEILADTVGRFSQSISPAGMLRQDYTLSARIKIIVKDSTDLGYAGLVFDRIDANYYRMLCISNKGTFYVKDVCNGEEELLIPKIPSRYLTKSRSSWNTVEIRHRKKEIYILFNGSLAAICKINKAFSYGAAGLVAATTENKISFSPVKAVFGNFTVKKIKE